MRLLDAQICDGELLLVIRGNPAEMFAAKAAMADILGCGVHLVSPGMMRRIRGGQSKADESTLEFLARIAVIDTIAGNLSAHEPVIVRHPGVMSGDPVFRGARVPPGPVFTMLADTSVDEIVRAKYPSLARDEIKTALRQAGCLLERNAPWIE
ncbi:DUF433 domain-containing protein [Bradyrhizobium sp. DASA03007]|uniref:DUF433 domain-containing protein n=1 Tax=unclassified Bradyrhizobium TaxID=2631580 RepID=UPI003F7184B4